MIQKERYDRLRNLNSFFFQMLLHALNQFFVRDICATTRESDRLIKRPFPVDQPHPDAVSQSIAVIRLLRWNIGDRIVSGSFK